MKANFLDTESWRYDRFPRRLSLLLAALFGVLMCAGCMDRFDRISVPDWDSETLANKAMSELDANQDGELSVDELDSSPGLKASRELLDKDKNGQLSKEEISTRIDGYMNSSVGLNIYRCYVYNGKDPLAGATVRFVPEPFLAGVIEPAVGDSDERGMCRMKTEGQNIEAMRLGIYRVEITSDSIEIPAKYNTDTELGLEVAIGVPGAKDEAAEFHLEGL